MLGAVLCRDLTHAGYKLIGQYNLRRINLQGVRVHQVDLARKGAGKEMVEDLAPDLVIHCAAMTNVEVCESEPDLAFRMNAELCGELARACEVCDAKFVMISTDQLWKNADPFIPEDLSVNPPNIYGESKAAGERLSNVNGTELIVRTNFFGSDRGVKPCAARSVLSVLSEGRSYFGFIDVHYTPISASLLSATLVQALREKLSGTYNIAGRERISKFEFAKRVAAHFGYEGDLIHPTSINDADLHAARPHEMSLSYEKIERSLSKKMPTLAQSLSACELSR